MLWSAMIAFLIDVICSIRILFVFSNSMALHVILKLMTHCLCKYLDQIKFSIFNLTVFCMHLPNYEVVCPLNAGIELNNFKHTMIRIGSDSLAMFFHCLDLILATWDLRNLAIYVEV